MRCRVTAGLIAIGVALVVQGWAQLSYPPALPGGKTVVTDTTEAFLRPPPGLRPGVRIARTPPTVDFAFYPGQEYPGQPWSVWGDGSVARGKYYSAIGDHLSPKGTARVFEYDPERRTLRMLVDLRSFLERSGALADGMNYTPGKIHCRIEMGSDGWLYYAGHRGSPRTTNDAHGFRGDWIFRTHPVTGKTEIVATHPVPKHVIPMGMLDPERMLFYGGTAPGSDAEKQSEQLFVYDLRARKVLLTADDGPKRYAILSRSTGRFYWNGRCYDPPTGTIRPCPAVPEVRSATAETPQGIVYGTTDRSAEIWAFDLRTERLTRLGNAAVGSQEYITSLDADPTGRYLYFVAGAHGRAAEEGTPVVQFDVRTRTSKVIAFLHPFYFERYGYTPDGTFSSALDEKGERLFVTWNGMRRGARGWECCALTVIQIPPSERE